VTGWGWDQYNVVHGGVFAPLNLYCFHEGPV
jgi:hypothetical protein